MNNNNKYQDLKLPSLIKSTKKPLFFFDSWQIYILEIKNIKGVVYGSVGDNYEMKRMKKIIYSVANPTVGKEEAQKFTLKLSLDGSAKKSRTLEKLVEKFTGAKYAPLTMEPQL